MIAASPSVKLPIEALGQAFERLHPTVRVRIHYDNGLDLRRTVAAIGNDRRFFLGTGPIDLIAPGGDELIRRLESKQYTVPGTATAYAAVPLVLVVPASLVEAPASFRELGGNKAYRVAVADPGLTELGRQTERLFDALGLAHDLRGRLDVASDGRGVLDHVLLGQADAGVLFGPDASREQERVRVVARAAGGADGAQTEPTVHSMAMGRYCVDRARCEAFLAFVRSPEGRRIVASLGYEPPGD